MSQLRFRAGEIAKAGKQYVEILSVESTERIFCRDMKNGTTKYFSARKLQAPNRGAREKTSLDTSTFLSEEETAEVARRFEILRPISSCSKKERPRIIAKQTQAHNVSKSTLYSWLKMYDEGDEKASSLKKRKKLNRKSRIIEPVLQIVMQVIAEHYETSQKPIAQRTIKEIEHRCWKKGLKEPSPKTIRRYIKLRDPRLQTKKRHGEKRAREQHDMLQGGEPHARHNLDVVQMDHSLIDVILVDSSRKHAIGRPWLTLAIDVYSRMVVGFYVSFENPSQFLVGLCLSNAMLSKDLWLESMGLDARNWPVWGKIERLLVDNAREFRSRGLSDLCQQYAIDLEFRGVDMPEHGGIVERFFGTLEKQVHTLPGSTFSNPTDRGTYDSAKRAALTLGEFEHWLANWIVSDYHITPHEGLEGQKPIDVWNKDIAGEDKKTGRGIPAKLDSDRESILISAMPCTKRVVKRQGVTWDYVHYKHAQFSRLLGQTIKVKRNPRNIKFIWFYNQSTQQWLRAGCRDVSFAAVSLWEFRATKKALRESGSCIDEATVFEGVETRRELVDQASEQRSKVTKKHRRALRNQGTAGKFGSDDQPHRGKHAASQSKTRLAVIEGEAQEPKSSVVSESFFTTPRRKLRVSED